MTMMATDDDKPKSILVPNNGNGNATAKPPALQLPHRAVHKIRLQALQHNYGVIESAAHAQRCSVIVVVKADGYGHGAVESAVHLASTKGAEAFAVATLEEGIQLRKAFQQQQQQFGAKKTTAAPSTSRSASPGGAAALRMVEGSSIAVSTTPHNPPPVRPTPFVRILVLGPPVNYPTCFDEYFHYDIECMVSGREVAHALAEWVVAHTDRQRRLVERAALESKELLQADHSHAGHGGGARGGVVVWKKKSSFEGMEKDMAAMMSVANGTAATAATTTTDSSTESNGNRVSLDKDKDNNNNNEDEDGYMSIRAPSATLNNVTGKDLAKEVRAILLNQKVAAETQQQWEQERLLAKQRAEQQLQQHKQSSSSGTSTPRASGSEAPPIASTATTTFAGIADAAQVSRTRQKQRTSATASPVPTTTTTAPPYIKPPAPPPTSLIPNSGNPLFARNKRPLRWHALVDTGMGRLGFQTQDETSVDLIAELVQMEVSYNGVIEFYGMQTHMADASNALSTFTDLQVQKFKTLLTRVRARGISVPTLSVDNSAALLTPSLKHFNANDLLKQENGSMDTRGFVRTGGGIYGQRPFPQLRAVSTLYANVRHVATLAGGESVGYDRAYRAPAEGARIATLTIGFADGYPRDLGNGVGKVSIRGRLYPVAGNVCMDMLMVYLGRPNDGQTEVEQADEVVVGDVAILWGPEDDHDDDDSNDERDGLVKLKDLAATLKTTQSALTCGLNVSRVSRVYE